jgi:hypothetical protein
MILRWNALGGSTRRLPPTCVEEWCPRRGLHSLRRVRQAEKEIEARDAALFKQVAPAVGSQRFHKREEQVCGTGGASGLRAWESQPLINDLVVLSRAAWSCFRADA